VLKSGGEIREAEIKKQAQKIISGPGFLSFFFKSMENKVNL